MALIVDPDMYAPGISENGEYIDQIPSSAHFQHGGMRCPCSRVEKCYETRQSFVAHSKSAAHQRWLRALNSNKTNHLMELEETRRTIEQQKRIIAQLEHAVSGLTVAIQSLSRQQATFSPAKPMIDLLDL